MRLFKLLSRRNLVLLSGVASYSTRGARWVLPGLDSATCSHMCSYIAISSFCRDYNVGDPPEPAVLAAAAEAALVIPPDTEARQFAPETDIVRADLVLVMDKYTAADVLREVGCPRSTCDAPVHVHHQPCKADGGLWHGAGCGLECCSVHDMRFHCPYADFSAHESCVQHA